mmetsp:Transcript_61818/g.165603  ORF Transcript_61818/g.165603 Transcript_61818/m.165603 type:complete len:366 (-) Transcript_61818:773-1870(-)
MPSPSAACCALGCCGKQWGRPGGEQAHALRPRPPRTPPGSAAEGAGGRRSAPGGPLPPLPPTALSGRGARAGGRGRRRGTCRDGAREGGQPAPVWGRGRFLRQCCRCRRTRCGGRCGGSALCLAGHSGCKAHPSCSASRRGTWLLATRPTPIPTSPIPSWKPPSPPAPLGWPAPGPAPVAPAELRPAPLLFPSLLRPPPTPLPLLRPPPAPLPPSLLLLRPPCSPLPPAPYPTSHRASASLNTSELWATSTARCPYPPALAAPQELQAPLPGLRASPRGPWRCPPTLLPSPTCRWSPPARRQDPPPAVLTQQRAGAWSRAAPGRCAWRRATPPGGPPGTRGASGACPGAAPSSPVGERLSWSCRR